MEWKPVSGPPPFVVGATVFAAAGLLVAGAVAAQPSGQLPSATAVVSFGTIGLLGSFLAIVAFAKDRRALDWILRSAVVGELLRTALVVTTFGADHLLTGIGAGMLLGGIASGVWDAWRRGARAPRRDVLCVTALGPITGCTLATSFANLGRVPQIGPFGPTTALTYDAILYRFDGMLGIPAAAWCGRLLQTAPVILNACQVAYGSLLVVTVLALACYVRWRAAGRVDDVPDLFVAFVAVGVLTPITYALSPAAGPKYLFSGAFPWHLPPTLAVPAVRSPVDLTASRNCVPSVHLTWAILIWMAARDLRTRAAVQGAASLFLVLTALATLGLGEHYLIDLIVAVPFAVAVRSLAGVREPGRIPERIARGALLLLIVGAWIVALRHPDLITATPAGVLWAAVFATIATSLLVEQTTYVGAPRPQPSAASSQVGTSPSFGRRSTSTNAGR